ncbi:MAG: VTT domain-containing protein [Candidatus Dependentiae bacterium]
MINKTVLNKTVYIIVSCVVFWLLQAYTPLGHYFSLSFVQEKSGYFKSLVEYNYHLAVFAYMLVFIGSIAFSLPSSIILTLLGGYLFGALMGAFLSTIGVTVGASLAYIAYRLFFSDMLHQMYADRAKRFEKAMQEYGVSYLLMLHFSTVFPYFIINSVAALSRLSLVTVIWTTAVGFIPQGMVYAFAGKELGSIKTVSDVFSTEVVIAFILLILLACIPILLKKHKKTIEL